MSPEDRAERGNVTLIVAVLLGVAALTGAGVARLGAAAIGRAHAQAAADAAALAGAADGENAAASIARANDAELNGWETHGDDVVVTVRRGAHTARARARWERDHRVASRSTTDRPHRSRTLRTRGHEAIR